MVKPVKGDVSEVVGEVSNSYTESVVEVEVEGEGEEQR